LTADEDAAILTCFIDFAKRMLNYDPAVRINAARA
jgi:hypothetical protein